MQIIIAVITLIVFIVAPSFLNIYSLKKSSDICKQVKYEQPSFFSLNQRYKIMTEINSTQFIFYIISGKYKFLENPALRKVCAKVKWMYLGSLTMLLFLIGSIALYSYLAKP